MSRRALARSGVLAMSLVSACSNSPPSGTAGWTGTSAQPDPQGRAALTPTRGAEVASSQGEMDDAMRKRGYKPATYRGERVYCRSETLTGSNLESKVCLSARQIEDQERAGKDILNGNRPAGCPPRNACN